MLTSFDHVKPEMTTGVDWDRPDWGGHVTVHGVHNK